MDGRLDIIVGDRLASVNYFRRLSNGDIYLIEEPKINVAGKPINVGYNSAPSVVDWNNDSLPDLVVGRTEGIPTGLYLYINEGTAGAPLFNEAQAVPCAGEPIQVYATYPDFGDMNNDGLIDLVLGSSTGRIECYTNQGTADSPLFVDHEDLRADGEVINFNSYIRPSVCDWNEDGIPDILASGLDGTVNLYTGQPGTGLPGNETVQRLHLRVSNPAVDHISVSIELQNPGEVTAALYSVDGRLYRTGFSGTMSAGVNLLQMDISDIPAGAYLLVCSAGDRVVSQSVVVLN